MNSSVLARHHAGRRIPGGLLDIGANNITLAALTFVNQADFTAFSSADRFGRHRHYWHRALRVNGEINVIGVER